MENLKSIVKNIVSLNFLSKEGPLTKNSDFHALMNIAGCPIDWVIEEEEYKPEPKLSKRGYLVKFAKEYAEDLKTRSYGPWEYSNGDAIYKAEYFVYPEKRIVKCMLLDYASNKLIKVGVAKCHREDCFNEYIGKAIALSRALGEYPPCDFFAAPEPEGFEVGDIIEYKNFPIATYRIDKKESGSNDLTILTCDIAKTLIGTKANSSNNFSKAKVIDDSARY